MSAEVTRAYIEGSILLYDTDGDGDDLASRIAKAVVAAGLAEHCEVEFEKATPAHPRRNLSEEGKP